jgi:ParB family chromosome partitioning protein
MLRKTAESKRDLFMIKPEDLTLVYDKEHPLYDPRVEDDPPESMILNIMMNGVLQPINVRVNGDKIEVVAGRGRTKAALEANRRLVAEGKPPLLMPCINKSGTDADLFGVMVSENEIRREDTMIVKGMKARKLLNLGYSHQQIAVIFGASRQAVENWLAADELPQQIKDAVEAGEMSATVAVEMGAGQTKEQQVKQFEEIKEKGVKPTIHNVSKLPKVKRRKEIEAALSLILATPKSASPPAFLRVRDGYDIESSEDYEQGYRDALRWVLGEDGEAEDNLPF